VSGGGPQQQRSPRALRLSRALERALLVGSAVTSTACCGLFSRWSEGYHYTTLEPVTPAQLPPDLRTHVGSYMPEPSRDACESICGDRAQSCKIAQLLVPLAEQEPHVRCDYRVGESEWRSALEATLSGPTPSHAECEYVCSARGREVRSCALVSEPARAPTFVAICRNYRAGQCVTHIPSGRTPAALACEPLAPITGVADYFARAAYLEQASVLAFEQLAGELRRHAAPARLVRRALSAAGDERRHARTFTLWAARGGASPQRAPTFGSRERTLLELSIENAVEGCVAETYSALIARYQARHVGDARLARALERVAREESEHAQLSWDIWRWSLRRCSKSQRTALRAALARASRQLAEQLPDFSPDIAQPLGLPSSAVARQMFASLYCDLWRPATLSSLSS
jgi:hypothetical protein